VPSAKASEHDEEISIVEPALRNRRTERTHLRPEGGGFVGEGRRPANVELDNLYPALLEAQLVRPAGFETHDQRLEALAACPVGALDEQRLGAAKLEPGDDVQDAARRVGQAHRTPEPLR
jgi:hypothetical protein